MASTFKAIIVGGGPTGLMTALMLQSAGIDFMLLEQRDEIVVEDGYNLILSPENIRIFYQLGLFKKVRQDACAMTTKTTYTRAGFLHESNVFHYINDAHGMHAYCFQSEILLEILNRALRPSEDKILVSKRLTDIKCTSNGVSVTCEDGSIYTGSIVIGIDGSRGKTRRTMREMALRDNDVDRKIWEAEGQFPAHFKYMSMNLPRCSHRGTISETHSKNLSLMYVSEYDKATIHICEKLDKPVFEHVEFTRDDEGKILTKFKEFIVADASMIMDVAFRITTGSMSLLEEGVAQKWSYKRIVLVGDACHKVSPFGGLDFNMGIQDAVALVNSLRKATDESNTGEPTADAIDAAFKEYHEIRASSVARDYKISGALLRVSTWANWFAWFISVYTFTSWFWEVLVLKRILPRRGKSGLVLNHVSAGEKLCGSVPWDNKMTE